MFVKRVFVSHYCNVPYHVMLDDKLYPRTLVEELFEASYHLMRCFELSPWSVSGLDEKIEKYVRDGRV
jgi:hypothetical protein